MSPDRVRQSLDQLRSEIEKLEGGDESSRERLNVLVADIEHKLSVPDDVEHHDALLQNLRDAIAEFEVSHPRTTGILNHIMVTLGNMGI